MKLAHPLTHVRVLFTGRTAVAISALMLTACASVPDVNLSYQPVTWAVGASVVHTITCARDGRQVIIARDGAFTPSYKADKKAPPLVLRLKDLDRFFADSDLTMAYTDDGRLKSINQSTTGQGETITKALVGTVTTIGAMGVAKSAPLSLELPPSPMSKKVEPVYLASEGTIKESTGKATAQGICSVVRAWTRTSQKELPQISVIFTNVFSLPLKEQGGAVDLEPGDDQAKALVEELDRADLRLSARVTYAFSDAAGMTQPVGMPNALRSDEVGLTLQQTRGLVFAAFARSGQETAEKVAAATVVVPRPVLEGTLVLPIPKPALFGRQTFALVLADSGRIGSIGYGRTAGAAGALGAATAVAGEQTAEDTAKAAALKAAADVIAQQTRTSACVLKPSDCK